MEPVTLHADGLVLDQPTEADIPMITEYCQDPLFEEFLTIPWPYRQADAEFFVREVVQPGWRSGDELTWAIRHEGTFLGVISLRAANAMIGYWIGAEHRGYGYMSRAVSAVIDWAFESDWSDIVTWEARIGNVGSMATARKMGFQYTGIGPASTASRDGSTPECWRAQLRSGDDLSRKVGWPDATEYLAK